MSKHITIKVYYVENKSTKEIRKFSVEEELVGSFGYLIGKIRTVFPDLLRKDLELSWKGNTICNKLLTRFSCDLHSTL